MFGMAVASPLILGVRKEDVNMIKYFRIYVILITLVLPLLFSCVSNKQPEMAGDRSDIVLDIGDYTIVQPSGGGWDVVIDKEEGRFTAEKLKKWLIGKILDSTLIKVFQNKVIPEEKWSLSEEQVADEFRNTEERIMKEAAQRGEYDLKEGRNMSCQIGSKKLYAMKYKITKGFRNLFGIGSLVIEAMLYLYFPPDFKETHSFYGFLISESYERGWLATKDLEQIYPIINSFQLKNR